MPFEIADETNQCARQQADSTEPGANHTNTCFRLVKFNPLPPITLTLSTLVEATEIIGTVSKTKTAFSFFSGETERKLTAFLYAEYAVSLLTERNEISGV